MREQSTTGRDRGAYKMKQDKAHVKIEYGKNGKVLSMCYATLEENGFAQQINEDDWGFIRITLLGIERDKAHDYEKEMGLGEKDE